MLQVNYSTLLFKSHFSIFLSLCILFTLLSLYSHHYQLSQFFYLYFYFSSWIAGWGWGCRVIVSFHSPNEHHRIYIKLTTSPLMVPFFFFLPFPSHLIFHHLSSLCLVIVRSFFQKTRDSSSNPAALNISLLFSQRNI